MQELLDAMRTERDRLTKAITILEGAFGRTEKRPVHWTQRPENRAKVQRIAAKMSRARLRTKG
jgi:hypothetical protein